MQKIKQVVKNTGEKIMKNNIKQAKNKQKHEKVHNIQRNKSGQKTQIKTLQNSNKTQK